jgi:hypothetical protein
MNIFEKLFKKLFGKKEKQTIAGKSINELINETLIERKNILKEIEINHPDLIEIDIAGEVDTTAETPKMSAKKTNKETTQPTVTTETTLPKKKKYKKKPKPKQ